MMRISEMRLPAVRSWVNPMTLVKNPTSLAFDVAGLGSAGWHLSHPGDCLAGNQRSGKCTDKKI